MHELLFAFVQNYGYLNNMKKNIKDPTLIEADGLHRFVPYLLNRISPALHRLLTLSLCFLQESLQALDALLIILPHLLKLRSVL